jgi:hypothetical protein
MKIAILMAFTQNIFDWCQYTINSNKAYATRHNYSFIVEEIPATYENY